MVPSAATVRIFQRVPQVDKFPPVNSLDPLPGDRGIPSVTTTDWVAEDEVPLQAFLYCRWTPHCPIEEICLLSFRPQQLTIAYSSYLAGATNVDNTHLLTHKHLPLAPTSMLLNHITMQARTMIPGKRTWTSLPGKGTWTSLPGKCAWTSLPGKRARTSLTGKCARTT